MSKECTIYIDEAGDLGIKRGTQWFVLTAVIVDKDKEPELRNIMKQIKGKLNLNNIHFRKLRDFNQKSYVVRELSKGSFIFVNVIVDTNKINIVSETEESKPAFLTYNYACRMLLERVSWYLRDTDRVGKICLSSRGTSRDQELIDYINDRLLNYERNEIASKVFTKIISKPATDWDMLQLADVCATSAFYQYETNSYGFIIPCFMQKLKPLLYSRNGNYTSYGLKYYSADMRPTDEYFRDKVICK